MLENLDVKKNYNNTAFGTTTNGFGMNSAAGNPVPPMQAQTDMSKINEAAADSYLGQRISSFEDIDPLIQYGVTIPTWIVINQAMDRYLAACRGDYNGTIIHKFGAFGDKVSSILFDNPVGQKLNELTNKGKRLFKTKIYDNSAMVRAFDKTPSIPELGLVKTQTGGIKTMLAHDNVTIWDKFVEPLTDAKDFDSLGASKTEIQNIQNRLSKISGAENKRIVLQAEEFRLLDKSVDAKKLQAFKNMNEAARLAKLKELKVHAMGFKDLNEFETIKAAPEKHLTRILEILNNPNKKLYARISYSNKNFGTILKGELTGRKVYFSELYNKLYAASGGNHKSVLGRSMVKLSNMIMEGASSRIQGGKLAALMQAYFLAEVIIRANRQETNSDKFKSFMERFAELIGFFVFIPPSLKLMHKIGGLQYSGMTPKQIEQYRKAVEEFNKHVMNCDWTKDVFKQKRKDLRAKFRPKTNNPFVWAGRKVGDIITVGLEQVRPYTKHKVKPVDLTITNIMKSPLQYLKDIPKRLADVMRNPKYWAKQAAGYPVRFGIPMLVFIPFFNKYLVKGVNAIFGKPKEGLADESKYEEQKEKAEELAEQQRQNQAAFQANNSVIPPQSVSAAAPVTVMAADRKRVAHPAQISYTGRADKENTKKEATPDIPKHRYIPSTKPVKVKEQNISDKEIEKAMKRLDRAEKRAYTTLSDKF